MRILVMTAVTAEQEAVLRGLRRDERFDVKIAGVGPAAAAMQTAKALAGEPCDLVVSAGIGGGYTSRAEVGSIVVASEIIAADLGVETPHGFRSVDELDFGSSRLQADAERSGRLAAALSKGDIDVSAGAVLTVSTASGTAATAAERASRFPEAAAEAMEGYGVALAAYDRELPVLELRAISNIVGPRDLSLWRIQDALDTLEKACFILTEVLS